MTEEPIRLRQAARVILIDEKDRVLLVRGYDQDAPQRFWWFLVGGGLEAGETSRQAAVREVKEEAGLDLSIDALIGPVFTRSGTFVFARERVRQNEEIFFSRVDSGSELSVDWDYLKAEGVDDIRWFDLPELSGVTDAVFPIGLPGLIESLLTGWDGATRHLR